MTTYEIAARNKKVAAIVSVLRMANVTADEARVAEPADWKLVADAANVNPPSAETIRLVIKSLEGK